MSKTAPVRMLVSCVLATLLLLAVVATSARAADTLDQSVPNSTNSYFGLNGPTFNPGFGSNDPSSLAQTFTPGLSGLVDRAQIYLGIRE
jgi:hypothetical protein